MSKKKKITPKSQHMSSFSPLTECHGFNCAREKQRRSIPSLNSSRLCRALRPVKRAHSNHLVPLCEKRRANNKILKVKRKLGSNDLSEVKVSVRAVTLFQSSFECATWDRKLQFVLSSLIRQIRTQDHRCNFSITFSFVTSPPQLRSMRAEHKRQTCGFIFTAFHSRKAQFLVIWYAPFYPRHRSDSVSRNLTSSRLDRSKLRRFTAHNWHTTVFS